jgi:hypothetical protein
MPRNRLTLIAWLVVAALAGFGAGWWVGARTDAPIERRAHQAAEHIREAFRALTH